MTTKLKSGNFSTEQLNQLVARIERLEEEKKALADDIKEVYAEAKAHGFDTAIMRQVIKLRKMDPADMTEQEHLLATYMHALGMNLAGGAPPDAAAVVAAAAALPLPPNAVDLTKVIVAAAEVLPAPESSPDEEDEGHNGEHPQYYDEDDDRIAQHDPEPATMHAGSSNPDYDALGNIPEFLRRT